MPEPDWRSVATCRLQQNGLKVLNPLELTWLPNELGQAHERRVRNALSQIDQCDALLANLHKSSYGTAMELFYAHQRGKVVTVIGQSPFSPWVVSHSQARFEDFDEALDFLIGEQPRFNRVAFSNHYEGLLAERYEQFPPDGEHDYQFLGGDLPVLLVAPHATASFKEGEFQEADAYTGALAALLHRLSGCHSLISNFCSAADPCFYRETPLRRAFTGIVKSGEIGLAIFLLGAAWQETPGLQVSTAGDNEDNFGMRTRLALSELEPVGTCQVEPLAKFTQDELGIPTVVVRLHKRYRMPRLQPMPYVKITSILNKLITEAGLELLRSRI